MQKNERGTLASANHLPESVQLQDIVEMFDDRHFQLRGRDSDMIEIAGKRGSLQEVNRILLATPGVRDGVVFYPQQERSVGRLAAIVVLADGTRKEDVIANFRAHLDAAFVPRPVYVVDALPREENGKLSNKRVLEFYCGLREK
jgi:acyl-coenzyme A synthetase/AMP-(fatty) acid ligase